MNIIEEVLCCDVLECFDEISVEFKFLSYEKEN